MVKSVSCSSKCKCSSYTKCCWRWRWINEWSGYDKAGGEQGGRGGGSGAYISDKVFAVTGGETLTATIGRGGRIWNKLWF